MRWSIKISILNTVLSTSRHLWSTYVKLSRVFEPVCFLLFSYSERTSLNIYCNLPKLVSLTKEVQVLIEATLWGLFSTFPCSCYWSLFVKWLCATVKLTMIILLLSYLIDFSMHLAHNQINVDLCLTWCT